MDVVYWDDGEGVFDGVVDIFEVAFVFLWNEDGGDAAAAGCGELFVEPANGGD